MYGGGDTGFMLASCTKLGPKYTYNPAKRETVTRIRGPNARKKVPPSDNSNFARGTRP